METLTITSNEQAREHVKNGILSFDGDIATKFDNCVINADIKTMGNLIIKKNLVTEDIYAAGKIIAGGNIFVKETMDALGNIEAQGHIIAGINIATTQKIRAKSIIALHSIEAYKMLTETYIITGIKRFRRKKGEMK